MGLTCAIPGCGRPTSVAAGTGRAEHHCRYHVQFRNRHGSHWHPSYRAPDRKPYISAATSWISAHQGDREVSVALSELDHVLAFAGFAEPAGDLRARPAAYRAKVAFARLREANVEPRRLLAVYLGVCALIEDDRGSHRNHEFRIVQAAKAAHRLASGTHKVWEMWNPLGPAVRTELHVYPRSSGLVLRKIGEKLEKAGGPISERAVPEIIQLKTARFGPHSSHLPGWRPSWDARGIAR